MTTFSLLIKSSPYATANHQAALDFATTLLTEGHMLRRVFLG